MLLKKPFLLKRLIFPFSCIILLLLVLQSCKKIDNHAYDYKHDTSFVQQFFYIKGSENKIVTSVIEQLKLKDKQTAFVSKLPENCGLPIWNKLVVQDPHFNVSNNLTNRANQKLTTNTASTNNTIIFIPLTQNNTALSSILIIENIDGEISKIYCNTANDNLYNTTHGGNVDITAASKNLSLFFYMENYVYGKTTFSNIPSNLLFKSTVIDSDSNKVITLQKGNEPDGNFVQQVCITYVCSWCLGSDHNCPLGGSWDVCTTISGEGAAGGGGSGSGGTGSGGGGSPGGGGAGGIGGGCPWYGCSNPVPNTFVTQLKNELNLPSDQTNWLQQNIPIAQTIYNSLIESRADTNPLTNLPYLDEYSPEAIAASRMTIVAGMNNYINQPLNEAHYNIIKQYIPNYQNYSYNPIFGVYFSLQCALLKL